MKTTELINELAAALSKAQAEIEDAVKDSKNPHFKNDYASLASVLEAVRKPLSKNGIGFMQSTKETEKGLVLVTKLAHVSGQWVETETPLLLIKQDMQGLGSAMTYARRYAIAALCGVSQVDDDANESAGHQVQAKAPYQAPRTEPVSSVTRVTRVGPGVGNGVKS